MSEELIKKCTSEAIKALSPLLDNEETTSLPITDMKMTRFLLSLDTAV